MKKWFIPVIVVVVLGLVASALLFNQKSAPAFSFNTLDGQVLSEKNLQGQVTLVNFWATTCSACVLEMPMLKEKHALFAAQGYQTFAVAMRYDPPRQVANFVAKNQLPFMVGLDADGSIAKAFGGVQLTPTSILIDKQGKIVKTFVGVPDFEELSILIQTQLKA